MPAKNTLKKKPKAKSSKKASSTDKGSLSPLEFMLNLLRDGEASIDNRKWAAYHAAPYCHSKLSTVDHSGDVTIRHEDALKELK
jgi:hypothetical protein